MHSLRGTAQAGLQANGLTTRSSSIQQRLKGPLCLRHSKLRCNAVSTSPLHSGWRQQAGPASPGSSASSLQQQSQQLQQPLRSVAAKAIAGTLTATGIIPLGYDFLTFLTATVMVVPACKWLKISPVLGFLAAGVALEQAG